MTVEKDPKKAYKERYEAAKSSSEYRFFPDIIYKDLLVSFGLFALLLGLAIFIGVANEPPADPNDSSYVPRPEWYFLWLFEMLKYFPGAIEWLGTAVIPGILVLALLLLPFYDRRPIRYWRKRPVAITAMALGVTGIVALTLMAVVSTPPSEEADVFSSVTEEIVAGQDLYSVQCVECHGSEGEGGEIIGVEGLEGVVVAPLNAPDYIYTRTDQTTFNIIDYGQQDLGMPPFGVAYGGELTRGDIQAIVTFMRYTWDDRVEIPEEAAAAGAVPPLGPEEIPTYDVHISVIIRRTCLSCHRPGKENGNYLMRDYNEVLTSGDNAPNLIAGDLGNNLIRMIYREEIDAGGAMPPTKELKPEWVEYFERWVMAGMPENPEDLPATPTVESAPAEETPEMEGTP
jgi:ubiquinol-cytochrome c reductase cytochrome b subunit